MDRVGIRGVLIMEVDQGIPKGPARFLGPKWRELFKFVFQEATRLGIQVNMNNDGGWCGSGGPWNYTGAFHAGRGVE
jgi:alpha-L-rhamnosidase